MRILCGFLIWIFASYCCAWNAIGHQLIAQIAYDHLNPEAKQQCDKLLAKACKQQDFKCKPKMILSGRMSHRYGLQISSHWTKCKKKKPLLSNCFVSISTWLDVIKYKNNHHFDTLHYIDIPYSLDGSPLPDIDGQNALNGIYQALLILKSSKSSEKNKALHLKILIHIVGDIHQPLHTITAVSALHPKGDCGGNLFLLGKNSIAPNLHAYWDRGGGWLLKNNKPQILEKAHELEAAWSCGEDELGSTPEAWIKKSHDLAMADSYALNPGSVPTMQYQMRAQNIIQKQIFFAGCRLAYLLNTI
ncbi:MAG: S1/P1 nuclease [Legionella sp.]|nr:S1/P1 nuclease [Legionella sp.]